jgi:hypothetical protein
MAVPEGGTASNIYNDLGCQPAPKLPNQINGALREVSTRGNPPPPKANAARPGKVGGAAKTIRKSDNAKLDQAGDSRQAEAR